MHVCACVHVCGCACGSCSPAVRIGPRWASLGAPAEVGETRNSGRRAELLSQEALTALSPRTALPEAFYTLCHVFICEWN